MESSFCGCDQGVLAGLHFDTEHLKAIGRDFCQALSMMKDGGDDWVIGKYVQIYYEFILQYPANENELKLIENCNPF